MTAPDHAPIPEGLGLEIAVDGPVLERFMVSGARAIGIQGPWGSGKSSAACLKLLLNALRQPRHRGTGKRKRVSYVVRNTFDQLERTTLVTWRKMFPPLQWGEPQGQKPKIHRIRIGDLEWDVWFVALDSEEDTAKLLSAELSDVWFNEAREIPRNLFVDALGRTDRWPDALGGCYRPQAIFDSNPAAEDHWISVMSGQTEMPEGLDEDERLALTRPNGWEILVQPPALFEERDQAGQVVGYRINPERENKRWTGDRYYLDMTSGASRAQIAERALNRPGYYRTGKAVWSQFRPEVHVSATKLEPIANLPILIGLDFGRTPAAVLGQQPFGQWRILRDITATNMGAKEFARTLKRALAEWFPLHDTFSFFGDPAGDHLAQSDDTSPFLMFRAEGLAVLPAPSNDPSIRIEAVDEALRQMIDGKPRFIVSPAARNLIAAMAGGYEFPRRRVAGAGVTYGDTPLKNRHSHVADALQYLVIGGGEGGALLSRVKPGAGRMMAAQSGRAVVAQHRRITSAWQWRER